MDVEAEGTAEDSAEDSTEDAAKEDNKGAATIYNTYINKGRRSIGFKVFILVI